MKTIQLLRMLLIVLVLLGSVWIANQVYLNEKEYQFFLEQANRDRELVLKRYESDMKLKQENLLLRKKNTYNQCMNEPYKSSQTDFLIEEVLKKYQDYHFSFYFEDIKNDYSFSLRPNESYYGASVIKLLDALYLIHYAMEGSIDLSSTIRYESRHICDYSLNMEKHEVGDMVSLEDLIYYAISVSDNTAHEMLYEYIGTESLRFYAQKLGIRLTITDREHFGEMTPADGLKILKEIYRIISLDNSYSYLLLSAMKNTYYNSLNFQDVSFLHKYGLTDSFYNELGIYYDENPYLLSLFTTYAYEDYTTIIQEFSKSIYEVYLANSLEKEEYCRRISESIF